MTCSQERHRFGPRLLKISPGFPFAAARRLGLGMAAAIPVTRLVSNVLIGVGAALLARYLPARRATRVDPIIALLRE